MADVTESMIPEAVFEAAAKADLEAREINPMTLYQKHGWPDDPPTDHVDAQGRMYFYAWRKTLPRVRAVVLAALNSWPGLLLPFQGTEYAERIILSLPTPETSNG